MKDSLLFNAIRGNVVFSVISALTFFLASGTIATFIGASQSWPFVAIGAILVGHGLILWFGSSKRPVPKLLAQYAIIGDIGWIIGTIMLLLIDPWNFTTGGKWLLAILADIVALFAVLQYLGLRRMT